MEGVPAAYGKPRSLLFEVSGEGTLPRVSLTQPTARNRRGQPLLRFRRLLLGRSEALPLAFVNDGPLPARVDIDLVDPDGAFRLLAALDDADSTSAVGDGATTERGLAKRFSVRSAGTIAFILKRQNFMYITTVYSYEYILV